MFKMFQIGGVGLIMSQEYPWEMFGLANDWPCQCVEYKDVSTRPLAIQQASVRALY